jgi:ATP-binding protein involved in chromosome partitioning
LSSSAVTKDRILDVLRTVNDPELHRDLVTLGMVEDLAVCSGVVSLTVNLTTPACPLAGRIEQEVRQAIEKVPGVEKVNIKMSAVTRKSIDTGSLVPHVSHVIAVGSGKGGVGKSTVASNLALALARAGAAVGLMDADVYGPNLPLMLGVTATPQSSNGKILPVEVHGIRLMSMGFFLKEDEPVIWRGPMLHGVMKQFLGDVEWGRLDYLVIDLPPGTGDVQLTLSQVIPLSGAVVVTTPQDVALLDARKAIGMFHKVNVPILGIIENMSGFTCSHCGERTDIFGSGGGRRIAERLGVPLFGSIPLEPALMKASDTGRPLVVTAPESPQARIFDQLAREVAARISVVAFERAKPLITIRPGAGA